MPKPSSCKKSAAPKPKLTLQERYACADLKEEIRRVMKKVENGPEKDARLKAMKKQLRRMKNSTKKSKKPAMMSLAEFDAQNGKKAAFDDENDDSSSSEDKALSEDSD
jgi:small-conductance mechanosensitive channel